MLAQRWRPYWSPRNSLPSQTQRRRSAPRQRLTAAPGIRPMARSGGSPTLRRQWIMFAAHIGVSARAAQRRSIRRHRSLKARGGRRDDCRVSPPAQIRKQYQKEARLWCRPSVLLDLDEGRVFGCLSGYAFVGYQVGRSSLATPLCPEFTHPEKIPHNSSRPLAKNQVITDSAVWPTICSSPGITCLVFI